MKKLAFAAVAATILLGAGAASAATVDFELNGNLNNSGTAAATITNNGATLGAMGLTFGTNQGPTISGLGVLTDYTLETRFDFDNTGGYRKLADFLNRASDGGFYVLNGGLNFYPFISGPGGVVGAGEVFTAKLVRTSSNQITGYINNVQQFTFNSAGTAVINGTLELFRDDFATGQGEASSGFVDWIRISSDQLVAVPGAGVPEPATWALMIVGFGAAGSMLRRRRTIAA